MKLGSASSYRGINAECPIFKLRADLGFKPDAQARALFKIAPFNAQNASFQFH